MNADRSTTSATLAGIGAILLWSTTIAVVRSLSEQVGAVSAGAVVYLVGGFAALARDVVRGTYPLKRGTGFRYLFGCGSLFVIYTLSLFVAVGTAQNRTETLTVALLNYLWPILTLLLSLPLLGNRGGKGLLLGSAAAVVGIFLVLTPGASVGTSDLIAHLLVNPWAYLLGLLAAVTWALYSNLTRRWAPEGHPGAVSLFMLLTGGVLFGLSLLSPEAGEWNRRAIFEALFMGGVTGISYSLWEIAMRRGRIVTVVACSYLIPLCSTLASCLYLGVRADARLWVGCLLLVGGSVLSWASVHAPED